MLTLFMVNMKDICGMYFIQIMSENKTEIKFLLLLAVTCFMKMTQKAKINMGSNKQSSTANPFLEGYSHNLAPNLFIPYLHCY